jgi:molybdopterin-guanine dinucleotide biosynthesis protein A
MIGLVLAGGKSTRMGQDKGLMHDEWGNLWAKKAQQLLIDSQLTCYISIHTKQRKSYSELFPPQDLLEDLENTHVEGPLKGLLSAHARFPSENILVIAADLLHLQFIQISRLIAFQEKHSTHDIWVYDNQAKPEPLCAIYSAKILAEITASPPEKFSLMALLKKHKTAFLTIPKDEISCFTNLNYPLDEMRT